MLFIYLVRGLGVRISAHPSHHDIGVNKYRSTLGILRILAKQVHLLINDNDHMLDSYLYYNIIVLTHMPWWWGRTSNQRSDILVPHSLHNYIAWTLTKGHCYVQAISMASIDAKLPAKLQQALVLDKLQSLGRDGETASAWEASISIPLGHQGDLLYPPPPPQNIWARIKTLFFS